MCVLLFEVVDRWSTSIKKINRLLNKEMCVLLLNFFNRCSLFQLKKFEVEG